MGKPLPPPPGTARWARLIGKSATPIFLVTPQRRLILFNHGCTVWTGWTADEVLSRVCDYVTEPDPNSLAAVLANCAPPPEVWQGRSVEVEVLLAHRIAPPQEVRIRFQPLLDDNESVWAVWGQMRKIDALSAAVSVSRAQALHAELAALRQAVRSRYGVDSIIAQGPAMQRVLAQIECARQGAGSVLLVGERGSGREHLARVIHSRSPIGKRAFVPLDCRQTPGAELKRTLKRLRNDAKGIEVLQPGTVYFRDIDAAPRDVQERLADWLMNPPAGESLRIMAGTCQPLEQLSNPDVFHRELYFLLTTLVIEASPLRQRGDDVLPLAQHFLEEQNRGSDRQQGGFTDEALDLLRRYNWPGNVAELRAVVAAAASHAANALVGPEDFPLSFRAGRDAQRLGPRVAKLVPLDVTLEQVEREQIERALTASRRNLSQAAELLGLTRAKLYRRIAALGLSGAESVEHQESPEPEAG